MIEFLAFAGSSVGFALVACLVVTIGWLALRAAGGRYARPADDLLVVLSVVAILVLTMRPGNLSAHRSAWQVLPFGDLLAALPADVPLIRLALADLVTNVILFAPLGAAIALRWPGVSTRRVVLTAAAFSTAIEITQGLTGLGRMAQSTDVLMNTLGACLAWVIVRRLQATRGARLGRLSAAVPRRR